MKAGQLVCGCFVKVHVCETCRGIAERRLGNLMGALTAQLEMFRVDSVVSVSALAKGEGTAVVASRRNGLPF